MTTPNTEVKEVKTNKAIDSLIDSIKSLWGAAQSNYMKLGEHFAQLRSETEKYQKNQATGISYAEAVRRTGVPRSTAEFYRSLYETCADYSIPTSVFLALQDSGVNLANDRFESAREMKELRIVDPSNPDAVSELAKKIKDANPAASSEGSLMERIADVQAAVVRQGETIKKTSDVDYKTFLEKEVKSQEAKLLTLQLRVIEVLHGTFGVADVRDSFREQTELRENLWAFVTKVSEELVSGFATGKKPAASAPKHSAGKQAKKA